MSTELLGRLLLAGAVTLAFAACSDDEGEGGSTQDAGGMADAGGGMTDATPGGTNVSQDGCTQVEGFATFCENITEDTTWYNDGQTILLEGLVFVDGATLTVEPGVNIVGDGTDGESDALVVATTGSIDAQGTADAPIVFGSARGDNAEPGDFGGVVLLGNASINVGTATIEGMEASDLSAYGGEDDMHSCGTLRYVRIEYAGSVFGTDNELNGLTLGGCGSDTTLEYIQSHRGLDDGIEFFGGTADMRYAVISFAGDDGLDWDEGYRGNIQNIAITGQGDNGIEADNLGDDNDALPRSNPTIWNMTIDCNGDERAMNLRRGTGAYLNNVIITRCEKEPFDIRDTATVDQINGGTLTMSNVIAFGNGDFSDETGVDEDGESNDDDGGFVEADWFNADNVPGLSTEDPQLNATWNPAEGSPAANGGTPDGGFDASQTQIGAFALGEENWAAAWINLN